MARLHYYQFPDEITPHVRYQNGAMTCNGKCTQNKATCKGCALSPNGWRECPYYLCTDSENTLRGITITEAKRLLKKFGGTAWTNHCDRDGGVFETTDIIVKGNNSKFQYNHHL